MSMPMGSPTSLPEPPARAGPTSFRAMTVGSCTPSRSPTPPAISDARWPTLVTSMTMATPMCSSELHAPKRAQELRIPFAAVMSPQTLLESDHLAERQFFGEIEQPGVGKLPAIGNVFRMSETPLAFGPAPALGADSAEVPESPK